VYKEHTVAVVVPAYNEERLIGKVLETMPDVVDKVVVVDDCSQDRTAEVAGRYVANNEDRFVLIRHERNQGVGGAIATGYKWARDHRIDATAVMAGDAQMDPEELPSLLDAVVDSGVDYAKGNRLLTGEAWRIMPRRRYLGNAGASFLTKIASGYWHVADSQSGYTVISLRALDLLDLDCVYKRYGVPNHLLVMLNVYNCRVRDVPIRAIYKVGETSGFEPLLLIPRLGWLLFKWFVWRLKEKYVIRDFHPLVLFYLFGSVSSVVALALLVRLLVLWGLRGYAPPMTSLGFGFFAMISLQFTMFAMWFDMEANKHLRN
jgi:glycosyltransferase involved in cell wall biosynthesis